jgi:murein DD-endopeptidase MepM/ murein hydrolase activator NlpD
MKRSILSLSYAIVCVVVSLANAPDVAAQAAPGTAEFDPRNPPTQTLVMRGETLFNIAERTRSPLPGLISANDLQPPYAIKPGQILNLPPLKVHVVGPGETFADIAARYNVDQRSLAVFNRFARPVRISLAQRIILPPMVIDRLTGLEPQDLVALLANEIGAGRTVTGSIPGQITRVTHGNGEASSTQRPFQPPPLSVARPPVSPMTPPAGPTSAPKAPATPVLPQTQTASVSPPAASPLIEPPSGSAPAMAGMFIWPVNGAIAETFGLKSDLRTLDGIEITAAAGTPFKAAAAGTIVYVGDQLPGYGWLVLIRHNDGIMSAYAYAQSVSVREGQNVNRGDVIGLVGTTGRARTPRLHFQIRHNTKPVDPLPRLPKQTAAA